LRFDFFVGLSSQRGHNLDLLFLPHFFARQIVVIEPGFTDRHDAWILRQFAQWRDHIVLCFFDGSWVYADCREDGRMFFCQVDRAPVAFERRAYRDNPRNARSVCAT
jgi:hypothetical protein